MGKAGFLRGGTCFSLIGVHSGKNGKRGIGNKYRKLKVVGKEKWVVAGRGSGVNRFF